MKARLLPADHGEGGVGHKPHGRHLLSRVNVFAQVGHARFLVGSEDDAKPARKVSGGVFREKDHEYRGADFVVHAAAAVEHSVQHVGRVGVVVPALPGRDHVEMDRERRKGPRGAHLSPGHPLVHPARLETERLALPHDEVEGLGAPPAVGSPGLGVGMLRVDAHEAAKELDDALVARGEPAAGGDAHGYSPSFSALGVKMRSQVSSPAPIWAPNSRLTPALSARAWSL